MEILGVINDRLIAQMVVRSIVGEVTKMVTRDVYTRVAGNKVSGKSNSLKKK